MSVVIEDKTVDALDVARMSPKITHVHDKIFKQAMCNLRVAKEMIESNMDPVIIELVEMDTLQVCPSSFIDAEYKESQSDILYSVKTTEQEDVYFYFLWEHQSTYDKYMPLRLLNYMCRIMDRHLQQGHEKLPIILPAVVYNGERSPYPGSCDLFDLFDNVTLAKQMMFKPFTLIDLTVKPDDELLAKSWSALPNMLLKHIRARDFLVVLKRLSSVLSFLYTNKGESIADTMLECIVRQVNITNKPEFLNIIKKASVQKGEHMSTIYEQLIHEGWEQGIEQGIERGREQEKLSIIHKLKQCGADASIINIVAGSNNKTEN